MNKHGIDQLTLRDVDAMARPDLIKSMAQLAEFVPNAPTGSEISAFTDSGLRNLVKNARRKFQQMGY